MTSEGVLSFLVSVSDCQCSLEILSMLYLLLRGRSFPETMEPDFCKPQ